MPSYKNVDQICLWWKSLVEFNLLKHSTKLIRINMKWACAVPVCFGRAIPGNFPSFSTIKCLVSLLTSTTPSCGVTASSPLGRNQPKRPMAGKRPNACDRTMILCKWEFVNSDVLAGMTPVWSMFGRGKHIEMLGFCPVGGVNGMRPTGSES
jgi:hypothetical protein